MEGLTALASDPHRSFRGIVSGNRSHSTGPISGAPVSVDEPAERLGLARGRLGSSGSPRRDPSTAKPTQREDEDRRHARRRAGRWRSRSSCRWFARPIWVITTISGSAAHCTNMSDTRSRGVEHPPVDEQRRHAADQQHQRQEDQESQPSWRASSSSVSRSNPTPLVMKKIGMRNPKPIASSRGVSACVLLGAEREPGDQPGGERAEQVVESELDGHQPPSPRSAAG